MQYLVLTVADAARTRIEFRQFRCPAGHEFRAACKSVLRTGTREYEEWFRAHHTNGVLTWVIPAVFHNWLPVPKCPYEGCQLIGDQLDNPASARSFAQIPESERFYAWLSPDGQRVSVPGYRGAAMPERYRRAGYMVVEAANLAQLDRLEQVRSAQTGNSAYHEMASFDAPTRAARAEAEYSDDMTSDV